MENNDMTVQEFYSGFDLSFMTEEERQTIYTATELYAKGKLRQSGKERAALEKILEVDYGKGKEDLSYFEAKNIARQTLSTDVGEQDELWEEIEKVLNDSYPLSTSTNKLIAGELKSKYTLTRK